MSISYEEALATLEAMFGEPWTRETLDAVLRHEKGHMENTCERILNHGQQDPQLLLDRLEDGGAEPQVALDEELARQLQDQASGKKKAAVKKGRGTPTTLPDDFLRVPGYKHRGGAAAPMDDEALARMLQDEMFSQELSRNPDFAHLARGGRGAGRGAGRGGRGASAGQRRAAGQAGGNPGPNVIENISKLGEGARRRLQMFAMNFENRLNGGNNAKNASNVQRAHLQEDSGAAAERRGLLDDDDVEEIEFEMKEKKSN